MGGDRYAYLDYAGALGLCISIDINYVQFFACSFFFNKASSKYQKFSSPQTANNFQAPTKLKHEFMRWVREHFIYHQNYNSYPQQCCPQIVILTHRLIQFLKSESFILVVNFFLYNFAVTHANRPAPLEVPLWSFRHPFEKIVIQWGILKMMSDTKLELRFCLFIHEKG